MIFRRCSCASWIQGVDKSGSEQLPTHHPAQSAGFFMPVGPLQQRTTAMTLTDDCLIERHTLRLIDRTLPKSEWTHAGHFAAALWLLRHRPDMIKPDEFRRLITSYNEATNTANTDSSGYHHTITIASIRAAAHHLAAHSNDVPIFVVLEGLMASPQGSTGWLLTYWSRETLFSVRARRTWVEPDIAALPF